MGRVFTTIFEYNGEQNVAMVTMCEEQGKQKCFHVHLFNQQFHDIIPEGKFSFTAGDNLLLPPVGHPAAAELFQLIRNAITAHLIAGPTAEIDKIVSNIDPESKANSSS